MSVYGTVYLFFKKKYTYKNIHPLFKSLKLNDFSLSPIKKSHVYNAIDMRLYEGRLSFNAEGNEIIFDLVVEEYEGDEGTNTIKLEFTGRNRATFEYVYFSDNFFSIFKKMKHLEGVALIGDDQAAPCNDVYNAFKNGDFDIFLQPIGTPFSSTFYFDALRRYLEKQNFMTEEQIQTFIQELKDKSR